MEAPQIHNLGFIKLLKCSALWGCEMALDNHYLTANVAAALSC